MTEFQIAHLLWSPNTLSAVQTISDPVMRTAVSAALLAVKVFKADAAELVRAGVEADIAASLALSDPPSQKECTKRRNLVGKWEHSAKPFVVEKESYFPLLRSVVNDPDLVALGLPGAAKNKMSVETFCSTAYDMAKVGGNKAGIMIVPKGSFLPVCRVAIQAIAAMYGKHNAEIHKHFFMKVFAQALAMSDINHFPYKSTAVVVGTASIVPVWNSWCSLGGADPASSGTIRAATLLPAEVVGLALRTALDQATANNVLGDWRCAHVALGDVLDVLKHEKLPQDFVRLGNADYVSANMDYVIDKFDFTNKLHTLALMYGFILKYMNPAIYTKATYPAEMKAANAGTNKRTTLAGLRSLPWQLKGGKAGGKGNARTDIFVVMFTAYVIGIYDELSPIGQYMEDHEYTLGARLTDKYSELCRFGAHNDC